MNKKRSTPKVNLVVCVRNEGYPASLSTRKIYYTIPDPVAQRVKYTRVIDESGDDYLYPASFFIHIQLPASVQRKLAKAQ